MTYFLNIDSPFCSMEFPKPVSQTEMRTSARGMIWVKLAKWGLVNEEYLPHPKKEAVILLQPATAM